MRLITRKLLRNQKKPKIQLYLQKKFLSLAFGSAPKKQL